MAKKSKNFYKMKKEEEEEEVNPPPDNTSETPPEPIIPSSPTPPPIVKVTPIIPKEKIGIPTPDIACPECKGLGIIYKVEEGKTTSKKCKCLLRKEVRHYLTLYYADAPYEINESYSAYEGIDLLIRGRQSSLKTLVKSFLLSTGAEYSHMTVSGAELFQKQFNSANTGVEEWNRLLNVDILILYLAFDTPNRTYGDLFQSVLEKRNFSRKATWIYSDKSYDSETFQRIYTREFVEYLKDRIASNTIKRCNLDTKKPEDTP